MAENSCVPVFVALSYPPGFFVQKSEIDRRLL
jgi:hypothetical protein